jgi:hypothetical protein
MGNFAQHTRMLLKSADGLIECAVDRDKHILRR